MKTLRDWWLTIAVILWLSFVRAVAGAPAAFFTGLTGLALCLIFLWEAGKKAERDALEQEDRP